jgi:small neutral amino acid transporter SnatA (MarC family)
MVAPSTLQSLSTLATAEAAKAEKSRAMICILRWCCTVVLEMARFIKAVVGSEAYGTRVRQRLEQQMKALILYKDVE